jgi:type III pantothenate kinase
VILLVDVGNTRIKWAMWSGGETRRDGVCPTRDAVDLVRVCDQTGIAYAVVVCVAGEAIRSVLTQCFVDAGIATHWVHPEYSAHGLLNRYRPPESLGADRYAALIGAARRFRRDCVVVSVGTAMTADMLTGEGEFLGGCIVPGPDLMRESLFTGTAGVGLSSGLPSGLSSGEWQDFPRDTRAAVGSGIALALLGVVQGMRARLAEMGGIEPKEAESGDALPAVILTGGARACLRPLLPGEVFEFDELVLEGLAWIARNMGFAD